MFFSDNILTRKGPLANIWLAAHWDRRLSKKEIVQTDIEKSVHDIVNGALPPMALRLSGQLLLGVTKIYDRKVKYLLDDCADAFGKLTLSFNNSNSTSSTTSSKKASKAAITNKINVLDDSNILNTEPELDLDALLKDSASQTVQPLVGNLPTRMDFEASKVNFGLAAAKDGSELPSEFNMDIELGRRSTMHGSDQLMSAEDLKLRESMEIARKSATASPKSSLPFSPLRTPTKHLEDLSLLDDDFAPMLNDDEMEFANAGGTTANPAFEQIGGALNDLSVSDIAMDETETTLISSKPRKQRRSKSNKSIELDTITELPSNIFQEQLQDSSTILMKIGENNDFLENSLQMLALDNNSNSHQNGLDLDFRDAEMDIGSRVFDDPAIFDDNAAPMFDDFSDFDDEVHKHSPKSPRILKSAIQSQVEEDQIASVADSDAVPTMMDASESDKLSEMIGEWKKRFSGDRKILDFAEISTASTSRPKRSDVANLFLELLVCQTGGYVKASQSAAYQTISITATDKLFE